MRVLGLESSCDETAAAVVENGAALRANVVASQVDIHARYGGIVPEVASRQHLVSFPPVIQRAMDEAGAGWRELGAIAVTRGPGLAGSLLMGISMAKALAFSHDLPLIGINHLEGHIYANWLECAAQDREPPRFPALCLVASGGHTDLVLMRSHGDYLLLGRTRDDAAGEAFDKAARVLGLGFPGGPAIDRIARKADAPVALPRARVKDSDDFSFSGLKTAMLRLAEEAGLAGGELSSGPGREEEVARLAAGFQEAVVDMLVSRTVEVAKREGVRQVLLGGGVIANSRLREVMQQRCPVAVLFPRPALCTDNAAMIACCAHFRLLTGERSGWDMDASPNWRLG